MTSVRGKKVDLFKWVDDQQTLDLRTKFILKELAAYADADCCAWAPVKVLGYSANCSHRTVQYHLARLLDAGLIKPTGRTHRLDDSTRSVPIYQLAPGVDGLGAPFREPGSMGAKIAPIQAPHGCNEIAPIEPGYGCNLDGGMGAIGLHPDNRDNSSRDKSLSPGARATEQAFRDLEAAAPAALLKFADRDAAWVAFCALADQGCDVGQLAGCAARMALDPVFRSRKFPPPLEDWIGKGQWRGWALAETAVTTDAPGGGAPAAAFAGPVELRAALVKAQGEAFVQSVVEALCVYTPGPPAKLIPRTGWAEDKLKLVRRVLLDFGVVVERERA